MAHIDPIITIRVYTPEGDRIAYGVRTCAWTTRDHTSQCQCWADSPLALAAADWPSRRGLHAVSKCGKEWQYLPYGTTMVDDLELTGAPMCQYERSAECDCGSCHDHTADSDS